VGEQSWPQVVATQGDLVADETTVVGAKVAGRIESVSVDLGDVVEAGAVLASLDRRDYQERQRQAEAELAQSRAAIGLDADADLATVDPHASPVVVEQKALWDQARADLDRIRGLRARQAVTDTQYEGAVAAEQAAGARHRAALNAVREKIALIRVRATQLEVARREFEDAEIRAPFHGRVQDRHVAPGMYVQVGDAVVTLIRDDPLRYRGTVPEPYASSIAVGQRVRLRVAAGAELPEVTITRISPALDPLSRSLLFEALVPNEDHAIQAGRFSQGEVILDRTRQVVALPQSAVVEFAGTRKVWKVVDGKAVEQPVETGAKRADLVEILGGLKPGDQVLIDGAKGRPAKVETEEVAAANPPDDRAGRTAAPR
jgi:RND family efflux transporter MFP subunit